MTVKDDNGTPANTPDDFNATYISGDTDNDTLLDLTETWLFRATGVATAGQYANIGTTTGTFENTTLTDTDPSHYLASTQQLPCPAGLFLAGLSNTTSSGDLTIAFDQFPAPNDNSYGANSIGWTQGGGSRDFKHLVNSDHAGFLI